jgi:hypothetical protein
VPLVDQELPDNHPGSFLVVHFVLLYALVPCCDIPSIFMQNKVRLAFTPFVCMSVWEWNVPFLSSIAIFLRGLSCFILIIPCSFSSNFFFLLFFSSLFLLTVELSVLLRFTGSNYPPLIYSNCFFCWSEGTKHLFMSSTIKFS